MCDCKCKHDWPADAPEWANYMVTKREFYAEMQADWFGMRDVIERPKPVLKKIDWSKLRGAVKQTGWPFWSTDPRPAVPSHWVAWNCDEHTRGNPLPDGLVVEWHEFTNNLPLTGNPNWEYVTRFRITGIQEGWE